MKNIIFLSLTLALLFLPISIAAPAQPSNMNIVPSGTPNKISLDVKGMDIIDVLKMLATRSGMSIVIGRNVGGKVTLFLKDVDTQDAFEIILLANGLAYDKQENIVNIMTQKDYELLYGAPFRDKKQARIIKLNYAKAADLSRSLSQFKTVSGRIIVDEGSNTIAIIDVPEATKAMEEFILNTDTAMHTKVFDLNYAQAEKLSAKLQEVVTKNVGKIRVDERTNKLIVTDYPSKIEEVEKIVQAFDEKSMEVLIDAQIINLIPSDQFQMGVDWDFWIKKYFDVKFSLPINTANALLVGTTKTGNPSHPDQFKAVLDILRTIGDTKVLSSPRIITLNNQEAKIHVGTRDAYITSTTSQGGSGTTVTSQSVNFVDVGLQLSVTPTINKDGFVTMKIRPELSESVRTDITSEGQITQVPIITTSEAESTVMVKDGVTIIIGGLRKDKRTRTVKKIPILGDIPWAGALFRSIDDKTEANELVILLTPHIMSGEKAYSDFSEVPPKDGAIVKMDKGEIVITKTSSPQDADIEYHDYIIEKVKTLAIFGQPAGKKEKREKGMVKLNFTLSRNGSLIDGPYVTETTNSALNLAAVEALKSAAPFAPFPVQVEKDKETFNISLSYE